jgi:hypothetical protein
LRHYPRVDADGDAAVYPADKRLLKKPEILEHNVALYFVHYNLCRAHQTLRVTPAMEAGISDHVWSLEEIVGLLH